MQNEQQQDKTQINKAGKSKELGKGKFALRKSIGNGSEAGAYQNGKELNDEKESHSESAEQIKAQPRVFLDALANNFRRQMNRPIDFNTRERKGFYLTFVVIIDRARCNDQSTGIGFVQKRGIFLHIKDDAEIVLYVHRVADVVHKLDATVHKYQFRRGRDKIFREIIKCLLHGMQSRI